ncbi:hypothetical protein P8452_59634 [Trifolium repens]|nr:hypothetical protein P8452_59634 [Trifolium repens]
MLQIHTLPIPLYLKMAANSSYINSTLPNKLMGLDIILKGNGLGTVIQLISKRLEDNLGEIDQVNCHNDFIHTFHNLTQLEFDCCSLHYNWKLVLELLKHCPKLQSLRLSEVVLEDRFSPRNDDNENWVIQDNIYALCKHFVKYLDTSEGIVE